MSVYEDTAPYHAPANTRREVPLIVQLTGTALFGAFAIVAVVQAFQAWWPAGVVLAIILGWRGGFITQQPRQLSAEELADRIRELSPEAKQRSSGNANFDAYRADMLARLEDEQDRFDGFLGRLREAKDRSEFDRFMDDRAEAANNQREA